VPEESFLLGKDARFCRAAFEDCFVVDIHNKPNVIASCRGNNSIETSMADAAALLNLFDGSNEFLMLPTRGGTLLVYPAWPHLKLALAFLLKETAEGVEKAYQNAKRYAFSAVFDAESNKENTPRLTLETKLCVLRFYMRNLFGDKRQANVSAHILMLANLVGCRLHEMSVSRVNVDLDEREMERLTAYLCCILMTMRRYNGVVSASAEGDENPLNLTNVEQEYGICIAQGVHQRDTNATSFELPLRTDIASFATHPAFADYTIEECDGALCLHISLHQKALLSSIISVRDAQKELTVTLFPL